ncbi:aromatic ring-hydroxylating oxygenase subunit alpha [Burkholderia multivorans]|uniref:aromatic ring-hydroxylating oxygenase subunit alpha n=1 Tax=Burkholderia multivorans TaxID=87883 RepID=UPI000D000475|nr:aromatic ring-hydroxylating dioxygenase subunit alpha [Burkholderia multivorans]PRF45844.1 (2Fe-2S)-binding protein [Burkholderia multivorans]
MNEKKIAEIKAGIEFEANRKAPPDGFPALPLIPARRYTDPHFYDLELKHVWRKSWLYAIHGDEVPEPGSYLRWDRMGDPLLFVRDKDGEVRCFYNTCRHRGAPVATQERGVADGGLVCGYHGWTYNLRGDLINLRDKRDFIGLDTRCRSLIPVRCESIGRYVFINLEPNGQSLAEFLGPAGKMLQSQQADSLRLVDKKAYRVKANLKVALEGFLETYHIASLHANTVDRFLDHRGTFINMWPNGHSEMITRRRPERSNWVDPGSIGLPEMETANEIIRTTTMQTFCYPNMAVAWAPTGSPAMLFWPTGVNSALCEVSWFAPSWGNGPRPEIWDTRINNFERILMEDLQFQEDIQKSLESHGYTGSTLNYQERRIYQWHEEADRLIGEAVPSDLRLPPVLEPFIVHE